MKDLLSKEDYSYKIHSQALLRADYWKLSGVWKLEPKKLKIENFIESQGFKGL